MSGSDLGFWYAPRALALSVVLRDSHGPWTGAVDATGAFIKYATYPWTVNSTATSIESSEFVYPTEDVDTDEPELIIACEPGSTMERNGSSDSLGAIDDQGHLRVPEKPALDINHNGESVESNPTGSEHVYK